MKRVRRCYLAYFNIEQQKACVTVAEHLSDCSRIGESGKADHTKEATERKRPPSRATHQVTQMRHPTECHRKERDTGQANRGEKGKDPGSVGSSAEGHTTTTT